MSAFSSSIEIGQKTGNGGVEPPTYRLTAGRSTAKLIARMLIFLANNQDWNS